MRSKVVERLLAKTPEDIKIFGRLYGDLLVRINTILQEKGYTQKMLAEKLDKTPSEISKWLGGEHNFTLRSLAKLGAELGEPLLIVPPMRIKSAFEHTVKSTENTFVESNIVKPTWAGNFIQFPKKETSNVG